MKLHAIRLREAGGFRDGRALEGLSGGLDVLVGPNELGKSTILHGLRALFFVPHSSRDMRANSPLAKLKPLSGGAPLLEVDFEIGGRRWRLRKQFFSTRQAILSDLDKAAVVARGDDADRRARELLDGWPGSDDRLSLLWVGQKEALKDLQPSGSDKATLRSLIEAQVHKVASGGKARRLRMEVQARLDGMITSTGRPKKNTVYFNALETEKRLGGELVEAQAQAALARDRLARLQELTKRQKHLDSAAVVKARDDAVEKAKAAHASALTARQKLGNARLVLENCLAAQEQAVRASSEFADRFRQLQELEKTLGNAAPLMEELRQKAKSADAALAGARNRQTQKRQAFDDLRHRLQEASAREQRCEAALRLGKINHVIEQVHLAETEMAMAGEALSHSHVTRGRLAKARDLAGAISNLAAQLSAAAAKVTVDYVDGGAGRIRAAGRVVDDGTRFELDRQLVLEIEGVGRISIEPGGDSEAADMAADADARREELADLLAVMAVPDLAAAEAELQARDELEARLAKAQAQMTALAPAGIHILEEEARQLAARAGEGLRQEEMRNGHARDGRSRDGRSEESFAGAEELARAAGQLETDLSALEKEVESLSQNAAKTAAELVQKTAALDAKKERRDDLLKVLPDLQQCQSKLDEFAAAVKASERAVNAATTDLHDWRDKAGDESSFRALETRLAEATSARQTSMSELSNIRLDIRETEGALAASAQDGVETRAAELQGRLAAASEAVTRLRDDIEALELLARVLDEAQAATEDRFLGPVVERIAPYLDLVLPGARLDLTSQLQVASLARSTATEPLNVLSDGTQEQIAVLVRLGFARLLAEAGTPVPLIFDDALVYSDDERIGRAFEAFRQAARLHQVIVLTCRSASFAGLGGNPLHLTPWSPGETHV